MQVEDIDILAEEFGIKQGWHDKTTELFTMYFDEHISSKRYVSVALVGDSIAGYATLLPNDEIGAFANRSIPVVCDFNVLKKFQRQGVGSALMDEIEKTAKQMSNEICLAVGLYKDYGTAQRMYVKRGYVPDGSGVWHNGRNLQPYEACVNDDDLVLWMSKTL